MGSVQVAPNIQGRLWRSGEPQDDFEVARIADYLGEPDRGTLAELAAELGLKSWAVEDAVAAAEALDDCVEAIEDDLFDGTSPAGSFQRRTFQMRRDLVNLRRVALPMREVINSIAHQRVGDRNGRELDPLYADLYDHVLRVSEWMESLRDMIITIFETNLSLQDAPLNVVKKKLTGWAAIVAVPTAIAGFYGQNVPYPGFGTPAGFSASSGVMAVLMVALYVPFQRRDWL
ncbi:CorA family divalent cation transporter [Mycobacterium servetii]|uniref:CorA family divalent cation transporter n=1 Tax=Mycobacterium servetii TaxID=3237418 RepID=A0ABV4C5M3_9MYCO